MASAMVSLGIATGFERRYGVLKRLGSTPLSRGGLLVAKTATVLALEVVQIAAHRARSASRSAGTCPAGSSPRSACCCSARSRSPGIGMLMAGTLRAEANLAAANGTVPRAAVPRRHGVPARRSCPTALAGRSPSCCPRPRCRRRCAPCSSPQAVPVGRARRARRRGRSPPRSSPPATSAGRNDRRAPALSELSACAVDLTAVGGLSGGSSTADWSRRWLAVEAVADHALGVDEERCRASRARRSAPRPGCRSSPRAAPGTSRRAGARRRAVSAGKSW